MTTQPESYDVVFSLGAACSCSQSLRAAELQFASFPFDWIYGGTPLARARGLVDGMGGWFGEGDLVRHAVPWKFKHESWRNVRNGIVFKPDFDWNTPLEKMIPAVREKYERRRMRLCGLLDGAVSALAVWINPPTRPPLSEGEVRPVLDLFRARWPHVRFDVLLLNCEPGRAFAARRSETRDGLTIVSYDYDDNRAEFLDNDKMARFLKTLLTVRDYRSESERRAWPARRRKLKYAQYNAKNGWDYLVNRMIYKLYRHFRKRMEQRDLLRLG